MKTGFSLCGKLHRENPVLALYGIAVHSGIHKLPNWRNIHQIVHWKNRMKGIRCYMTAIMNKEGTEKHKKLKSRSICGKWSLNKILILIGTLVIGGIQVLRHQRGGWVGWPNDDVWWQGGWVGEAKWWRYQKIYKEKKLLFACAENKVVIFLQKKLIFMQ